ncbi:MAG: hypothetical protein AAGF73_15385 [Actinomycetota bacterium]
MAAARDFVSRHIKVTQETGEQFSLQSEPIERVISSAVAVMLLKNGVDGVDWAQGSDFGAREAPDTSSGEHGWRQGYR